MPKTENMSGRTWAGRYVIEEFLGRGGMAVVYSAHDKTLKREVAVKILRPDAVDSLSAATRLQREARVAGRMHHQNIITLHDVGVCDDRIFIIMERLRGRTLGEEIKAKTRMEVARSCLICAQIASALRIVHGAGIIHRDLKPDNIYLTETGSGRDYAKLLDFSIAKLPETMVDGQITVTGTIFGTPHYMSIEQAMGDSVTSASDLYSLGAILFEMVTGRTPFSANNPIELITQQTLCPAPRATEVVAGIPHRLDALIASLLSKDLGDRPAGAREVEEALTAISKLPSQAASRASSRKRKRLPQADATHVGADESNSANLIRAPSAVFRTVSVDDGDEVDPSEWETRPAPVRLSGTPKAKSRLASALDVGAPQQGTVTGPVAGHSASEPCDAVMSTQPGDLPGQPSRSRSRKSTTRKPQSTPAAGARTVAAARVIGDHHRGGRNTEPRASTGRGRRTTIPRTLTARDELDVIRRQSDVDEADDDRPVGPEDETI